jgi:hypothetical protein
MTQPALSQALQRLEADLGVQLFVRRARGLTLTRPGDASCVVRAPSVGQEGASDTTSARWLMPRG